MKAREIVDHAVGAVEATERVNWRVGVTNDCERIFREQRARRRTCYPADNYKVAKAALVSLLEAGFNGINATLPLEDFKQVYLYEIAAERRYGQAHSPVAYYPTQIPGRAGHQASRAPAAPASAKTGSPLTISTGSIIAAAVAFIITLALSRSFSAAIAVTIIAAAIAKNKQNPTKRPNGVSAAGSSDGGSPANNPSHKKTLP